jgi:hypothetical protein
MIDRTLVCTKASLDAYLTAVPPDTSLHSLEVPEEARDVVTRVNTTTATFLIHASDGPGSARVVFAQNDCLDQLPAESGAAITALQRASRLALSARTPPIRLPPAWSSYHEGNLVAFFTGTRTVGALRWLAQIHPLESTDVFFCRVTSSSQPVDLHAFRPSLAEYVPAIRDWPEALKQAAKRFAHRAKKATTQILATVDLEATTYGAIVGTSTYSTWLERLTREQRTFLERPPNISTKLRGPAGTGKTLLLQLKALHETYAAASASLQPRILFITHSWAMAEQIDEGLLRLHDQSSDLANISVFPLLSIAQDLIPAERHGRGFDLLGEDNLSGKLLQLEAITRSIERSATHDWLAYEDRCSPAFAHRVTAAAGSAERRAFAWDLMHEFACVLSAHGILPGINAARNYLPLPRMPWMMPLETDGEKLFVLQIYAGLMAELRESQLLTSDQLINDFLNYLETFAWNLRRTEAGFDLLFVDELHLFNEQERLALSFLSHDPNSHPVMFMALDPRQSPSEAYTGEPALAETDGLSGEADAGLGKIEALDLTTIHRFSPEILDLVRHINNSYPALDLDEDWALDTRRLQTSVAPSGHLPTVSTHDDRASEVSAVIADVANRLTDRASEERIAIILVDSLAMERYAELNIKGVSVLALQGRDDVGALQYSKRAVVVSPAEYVAGLQFSTVIVAGFPPTMARRANLGHERRRLLSLVYLAVSRATTSVAIHVNAADGGIPDVLETAVDRGSLRTV